MLPLLAPAALLLLGPALPALGGDESPPELDYASFAKAFRQAHGAEGAMPGSVSLQAMLEGDEFRAFGLGLFDLRYPAEALVEKETAERFADAALAVLDLQGRWLAWVASDHEDYPAIAEDFELLHKWVGSWSSSALAAIGRYPDVDPLERLGASDSVREALDRVEAFTSNGAFLGLALGREGNTQILFAPNREWMMQLLCFTGWNAGDRRGEYWKGGVEKWTSFWNEETQVIALEYPAFPIDVEHPTKGAAMDEFEKTGLQQHAAVKAAASMFWHYFGSNDALFYEAALGTTLAISVYEQNNVRTGAPVFKSSGGSSQPYSVFVPGGNAAGGTLPGRGAVSIIQVPIWRETKGEDWFVKPLAKAMKKGGKLARKDRHPMKKAPAHFILEGEKEGDTTYVTAPFFGPDAKEKALPEKRYLVDYEEFFRAYRAGFFHWLQTRGAGRDEDENAARFRALNRRLATRDSSTSFSEVVEEIYGVPLSGPNEESDSLEWRYLEYLSKGGR
jgi:hypothetical protein